MKKRILTALIALLLLLTLSTATACEAMLDYLITEAENALEDALTTSSPGDATPGSTAETATDAPEGIPFFSEPEIPAYTLPAENFADALEKEASELVDQAIAKAIACVNVMKDDRHAKTTFAFEQDANGYLAALTNSERALFDELVSNAKKGKTCTVKAADFSGDLKKAYFALYLPLCYCAPDVASYVDTDVDSVVSFDTMETTYRSVGTFFYDPYRDQNYTVQKGDTTTDKVLHGAALLDRIVKRVVRFMPENLSAYDRYYYLAAFLSERVTYDDRPENCYTAFGALISGKSVCEGYAAAYYLLCREANLWCAYRSGHPDGGSGHIWNMVKLDSGIYNVDVTWCDGSDREPQTYRWYTNFVKSDADFSDHGASDGVESTGTNEPNPYEKA